MDLGQFSVSLAVRDIEVSLAFYQNLGFEVIDGGHEHEGEFADSEDARWRILQSADIVIGLFQGMFQNNILTFNAPDVRAVQARLKAFGAELISEADAGGSGPTHVLLKDPDGNTLMFDQHH